jgi:predicted hydrocarbon binding protein
MSQIEKKCKGSVIQGYAKYLKKKWGQAGLEECEGVLKYRVKDIVSDKWYPAEFNDNMLKWIYETKGHDAIFQAGSSLVSEIGIVSFAARVMGIKKILERGLEETRNSLNYGEIKIDVRDKQATVSFKDMCPYKSSCIVWTGILSGLFKITNTKGTVREVKCELEGGDACVYELKWE